MGDVMDEQEKARMKFRRIDRRLSVAQRELARGNLEAVVAQCFQAVCAAKHMADDVYHCERSINITFVGDLSHPEISRHIEPAHPILAGLKDKDSSDEHNAVANFMIGVVYLSQRRYLLAAQFLRAAADTFTEPSEAYDALGILCEAHARTGRKRVWRETRIEAMLLQPGKDFAFKEYASGVLRRDRDCLGLNESTAEPVVEGMSRIIREYRHLPLRAIDQILQGYVTALPSQFRNHRPIFILSARVG